MECRTPTLVLEDVSGDTDSYVFGSDNEIDAAIKRINALIIPIKK